MGLAAYIFSFFFFLTHCVVCRRECVSRVRVVKYQHPGADLQAPRTRTPATYIKREYAVTPLFPFVLTYFFFFFYFLLSLLRRIEESPKILFTDFD